MTLEIEKSYSPETIKSLEAWRVKHGLRVVLLDYDDSLCDTNRLFSEQEDKFISHCVERIPNLTLEELRQIIRAEHLVAYSEKKVNPLLWDLVVERLEQKFDGKANGVFKEGLHFFKEIYATAPVLFPGAIEALKAFREARFQTGLVTHGNEDWTSLKLKEHGIGNFFEHVVVAHEDGQKSVRDWKDAIGLFGVAPSRVLAIGDNINADILAAKEAGIGKIVHIKSDFKIAQSGILPEGILTARGIGEVIGVLLNG